MSKTYKLIQEYPGSFEVGHIAKLHESEVYYDLGTTTRSKEYIEKNPLFWQEVCEDCLQPKVICNKFGCISEKNRDKNCLSIIDIELAWESVYTGTLKGSYPSFYKQLLKKVNQKQK